MRKSGILLHIASLPNDYGIGTLGREAYDFADYLKKCGQTIWQILPLSQTSYGDSPYQSFSIYAGNPYFVSMETLEEEGLLLHEEYAEENWRENERYIEYGTLYSSFYKVMKLAYKRFKEKGGLSGKAYKAFKKEQSWLAEYSLFMALKDEHDGKPWNEWEDKYRLHDDKALSAFAKKHTDEIELYSFLQFKFFEQWFKLKEYVNNLGIEIIGDIPIYTAYDSVDVWKEPNLFRLDEDRLPVVVAGFPPDDFSKDGQLWGNPIYDWDKMREEGFAWWVARMSAAKKLYDVVRIDHFIGFDRYYAIPYGSKTAAVGEWCKGPGYELFKVIKEKTGKDGIIAEDLGIITPSVRRLLKQAAYPGMKVLQFAFDPNADSAYLPQNFTNTNCVVYTSTHDNDTVAGWFSDSDKAVKKFCKEYLGVKRAAEIPHAFIKLAWFSIADYAVTTIQDLCGYGSEARINIPSTLGCNWKWRAVKSDFSEENAEYLKTLTKMSNRNTQK